MKYLMKETTEVGGKIRLKGETLDESEFAPPLPKEQQRERTAEEELLEPILSEAESLVKSGHIEPVAE